jgi:hypothetical protein
MMSELEIWTWFVTPALAALMLATIGIIGGHVILAGNLKHPILRFGTAIGVVVAVAFIGSLLIIQPMPMAFAHQHIH